MQLWEHKAICEFQKKIPVFIKTPVLLIEFGIKAPEQLDSATNYFYAIRRHEQPVDTYDTLDDCFAEMPFKILFGTTHGTMIHGLKLSIEKIYQPAVEFQFRIPKIDSAERYDVKIDAPSIESRLPKGIQIMDFSRPSDFRSIAVKAKKSGFQATGDDSHLGARERRPSMSLTPSGESIRTTSELATSSSRVDASETSKESISERWERLLKLVTEKTELDRVKMMDVEVKKSAIKEGLHNNLDKFLSRIDWYVFVFFLPLHVLRILCVG